MENSYIGRLLDNRYEILEVIGTGGMAVVYKARCHRLNRLVAIKILKDEYSRDDEFRRRFHSESQAVAMLSHPNIVSVYDVSTSSEADYIVMELIDGITLKQYMEKKGVLNWKETLHFAIQIAKALEHAHGRGIVHRDIKPHNVMVLKNGSVKVTDFGIARVMSKSNTLTKEALGSVHYISPEQAKGGRVDNRSDIYSLGVVMYEMMTGRPPYDGESPVAVAIKHINGGAVMPSTLNPNIPGGLEQIIMKAMGHDVDDRYESATAMLYDMDEFRKEPSMLFDYNTPPTDDVTLLQKTTVVEVPEPVVTPPPATTAERVAAERTEQPRVRRERPAASAAQQPRTGAASSGAARTAAGTAARGASSASRAGQPRTTPSSSSRAGADARRSTPPARRRTQEEEEVRSKATLIAVIACSAVAILAIVIFLVSLFGGGQTSTPDTVAVPPLVGKDYSTLGQVENLEIILQERKYDDTYASGQIMYQNPAAGDKVAVGTKVYVDVSMGPEPEIKTMPDLTRVDPEMAAKTLDGLDMDLQILRRDEYNENIAKGLVCKTEPEKGIELVEGQYIYLYVSQGPEVVKEEMPNLVGMPLGDAVQLLNDLGINNVRHEYVDSDKARDEVVNQSVDAYSEVDITTAIILEVSNHSIVKVPMPNVLGKTVEEAADALDEKELYNVKYEYVDSDEAKDTVVEQSVAANEQIELTKEITLKVSNGPKQTEPPMPTLVTKSVTFTFGEGTTAEYKVMILQDGEPIYEGKFAAGEQKATVNLQGYGTMMYDIYIDDQYVKTQKVNFAE